MTTKAATLESIRPLQGLGFVEPHEVDGVKDLIDRQFRTATGAPFNYRTAGYFVAVRIHVRESEIKRNIKKADGTMGTLYAPDAHIDEDKYQSTTGIVCGIGPQAYFGKHPDGTDRFPTGPWCRIGDIVHIPRHECIPFSYHGIAMGLLADDRILGIVEDPEDIQAIGLAHRI